MDHSDQVFHNLIWGSDGLMPLRPCFNRLTNDFGSRQPLPTRDASNALAGFFVDPECERGCHKIASHSVQCITVCNTESSGANGAARNYGVLEEATDGAACAASLGRVTYTASSKLAPRSSAAR